MFGMIAMHFNDKIKKDMYRLHVKSPYHANKRQKISQCVYDIVFSFSGLLGVPY